jgi:type IV fimbrial biogenesis protein FimT
VKPARSRPRARGFTLIELLVTMSIAAILIMVVAPSFSEVIMSNKLAAFANNFVASAQLARSEAIKRNATVRVCRSADGATCATGGTWQQGWIVFHDANNNATRDPGETLIRVQQALSSDYRFTGDSYSLAFASIGAGVSPANLTLCRADPTPGQQERIIVVSATGRTSVTTTHTGACSPS